MIALPKRMHLVLKTVLVVAIAVAGLEALRWVAIRFALSQDSSAAFTEIRLVKGMSQTEIAERLGEPDARLHELRAPGEPPSEAFIYRRGRHTLELLLVGGKLCTWVETNPLDHAALDHARRQAIPCCPERGDRTSKK